MRILLILATILAFTGLQPLMHDPVPCNPGESGAQCQSRLGDAYEVIYYPSIYLLQGEPR